MLTLQICVFFMENLQIYAATNISMSQHTDICERTNRTSKRGFFLTPPTGDIPENSL